MNNLKKFVNDHKTQMICVGYGVLIGAVIGLARINKINAAGMKIVDGELFNTDDNHLLFKIDFANGTTDYWRSLEELKAS